MEFGQALNWRLIGPFRGGRVPAVAGDPELPLVHYAGACAGGLWRTGDGGWTWENISDNYFGTAAVGAIAVAASDPNVIYVGTGEANIRNNVCHGDGMYRSTDRGRSWQHLGLAETRHIARVRVDPGNPDTVYVAAFGHAFGPNPERGIYRSNDGGRSWRCVLNRGPNAGAIDLCLDPRNSRVLYAAVWEARRQPWTFTSGGPGSGLFKSVDGGDSWQELTDRPGLPGGIRGRIGVTVSPARPERVWALVEAAEGGLYRSDDGGLTWSRQSGERGLWNRAWYYSHIFADPLDPERLYVLNVRLWRSDDGGATFVALPSPHGDHHDLWLDPRDPMHVVCGNDGGACISYNGGATWSTLYNQPTAQFYHVAVDTRFPYRVYGAQQDNTTLCGPSRSMRGAIAGGEWYDVGGGESGFVAVRPDDPDIVYAGNYGGQLTRYDHRTGQVRNISVWPESTRGWAARDVTHRFQWTYPIAISPHDPDTLYVAANRVYRSRDEGASWLAISPDLTRDDGTKMGSSGGPITKGNMSAEYYGTVFAFAESPVRRGLLWAGSDDGRVHVSMDDGRNWADVTPGLLPEWSLISCIEPSPHNPAVAYLAANRYKLDDLRPLLLRTGDYGRSWQLIVTGLPPHATMRVVRADPVREGLLYAGSDLGVYTSLDQGDAWMSLQSNLPIVPVHDLVYKDGDLVAATHGRGFWILDDVTPLQLWQTGPGTPVLFRPRPAVRSAGFKWSDPGAPTQGLSSDGHRLYGQSGGDVVTWSVPWRGPASSPPVLLDAGSNPPSGAVASFWLPAAPVGEVALLVSDGQRGEIRRLSTQAPAAGDRIAAIAGLNRVTWDMRLPGVAPLAGVLPNGLRGPRVLPGSYTLTLQVGGTECVEPLEIRLDPRVRADEGALAAQFDLLLRIQRCVAQVRAIAVQIRTVREQGDYWLVRSAGAPAAGTVRAAVESLRQQLQAVEAELTAVGASSPHDRTNFPVRLAVKLVDLAAGVESADAAPTRQAQEVFGILAGATEAAAERLREVLAVEGAQVEAAVAQAGLPAIGAGHGGE